MFFILPGMQIFFFFLFLAVLPALFLMIYVYQQDSIEHEPVGLLMQLLGLGVVAGFLSMILENIGTKAMHLTNLSADSPLYTIIYYVLVVGLVEEGMKDLLMGLKTWKNPAFNFRFDGIVYAVFTSLGFAAMENIMYFLGYGPSVLVTRAFLAIPGHASFAVIFGIFYGRAKRSSVHGHPVLAALQILCGYILAVLLHGIYDTCATLGTGLSTLVFAIVVIIIYVLVFSTVKKEARSDESVYY